MTGETDSSTLLAYLDLAGSRILARLYPFRDDAHIVPPRYQQDQIEIAAYLLNKRGAEGETAHNENGIGRSYEAASVPESMLKHIVPFGKVLGGSGGDYE